MASTRFSFVTAVCLTFAGTAPLHTVEAAPPRVAVDLGDENQIKRISTLGGMTVEITVDKKIRASAPRMTVLIRNVGKRNAGFSTSLGLPYGSAKLVNQTTGKSYPLEPPMTAWLDDTALLRLGGGTFVMLKPGEQLSNEVDPANIFSGVVAGRHELSLTLTLPRTDEAGSQVDVTLRKLPFEIVDEPK